MTLSDGEKLIALLLCDLRAGVPADQGIDPKFITRAISDGHLWAIKYKYPGAFDAHEVPQDVVTETYRFLTMWDDIAFSYDQLSDAERDELKQLAPAFNDTSFRGFDGNGESEYISVASLVIEDLDSFSRFTGRDLNSHMPMVDTYRRMYTIYEPMVAKPIGPPKFSAKAIASILAERTHPSDR